MSEGIETRNGQLVERLFKEVLHEAETPNFDVLDEIMHEDYIQHNPLAGQGRAGLKHFIGNVAPTFTEIGALFALPIVAVNYVEQGDYVVRQEIRESFMLVDIFRIEGDLIREHWEAWHFEPGTPRPAYMVS